MSKQHPSMQEVIQRLHTYWSANGCTVWHPYSEKVGAGTMNPATVLRVLGPEPWNVAYTEPSYRTDDGRYGDNPNRMQMHHQYQVILKPDPGNPQELYLGSLEAIGLDRNRHDIRFVEDNWESPALGAWGLGWEVWLDGQEITQFTYFQQSGSLPLEPVSVEITYGLDRIVMYLQEKTQVWDIDVDGDHTFAELYKDPEIEHCVYNYEVADVDRLRTLFDIYNAEAQSCIERGLTVPAHDFVLRQSHTFNLMDSRGAVGVTERAKMFGQMRRQAKSISELYIAQRERNEYPWLPDDEVNSTNGTASGAQAAGQSSTPEMPLVTTEQSFLLEIGSEELPAADVPYGLEMLQEKMTQLLDEHKLSYQTLSVDGTCRRLVAYITGLAPNQPDEVVEKRGPSLDRAYDEDGNPTKAAQGFARGQDVDPSELEKRDGYIYAVRKVEGQPTAQVLPTLCIALLESLRWGKSMRWNRSGIAYSRPLRWLVALYGDQEVSFSWADVSSGRESRKPRFAELDADSFDTFTIKSADGYFEAVSAQGVVLKRAIRKAQIAHLVADTVKRVHAVNPDEPSLLEEVTDLVEAPQAILGHFEEKYLQLPSPVLIAVMKKHQRYFPVIHLSGDMLPYFVTIANANSDSHPLAHPDVVKAGNEGVIRARYADAEFFYKQDTEKSLSDFTANLSTLTFHQKLGSMLDKVGRLTTLAPQIGEMLGASDADIGVIQRAAELSKSDLATSMVVEMTSLQGIMGEIYAKVSGESDEVGQAIREQYLPRSAGDANPASGSGLALSLADKLDSLAGLFAAGAIPTGSTDPFGLRRAALGIVNNLMETETDFDITEALGKAAELMAIEVSLESLAETETFIVRRLQGVLAEIGFAHDVVDAVLAQRGNNPTGAQRACQALSMLVDQPWWSDAFTAYARCARITRNLEEDLPLNANAYEADVEHDLHRAYETAVSGLSIGDEPAERLGEQLHALQEPINAYFDSVMVNAEDEMVRNARLALVQNIAKLAAGIGDLSQLQGF
ncbi:MAG: glycine--tRNA ligase subunit beta [Chloroflexota bacterium]